jgi:glycerol-3-phosphate acyltransferase PlsY
MHHYWSCPLLAFLLGSIPFGLIIAKSRGIDIRAHGSGNIGATNVLRVMGKKYGIPCLILDMLKGFIPVAIAVNLIQINGRPVQVPLGLPEAWVMKLAAADALKAQIAHIVTALAAVLGHNYSPWAGFKGGKGIATSAGVLLGLMPFAVLLLLAVWLLLFLTTRYVSVASIGASCVLPLLTLWGSWHHGRIQDGTWNKPLFVFTIIIAVLAVWKHRSNIRRLMDGTESRFERKRSNQSSN